MKKYLGLILFLAFLAKGYSQENKKVKSSIISSEYPTVNGSFSFNMKYVFQDTVSFSNNVDFDLPSGWYASMYPVLSGNTFHKGDSVFTTITINYPVYNLS